MQISKTSIRIAAALVLPVLALASCSIVTTPGATKSETRSVAGFSKVELAGSGTLTIDQTGTESLTIEAGEKVLPELTSDVTGDTLVLGTKQGSLLAQGGRISYHLTVKELTGLTVSGSGDVTASKITSDQLVSDISGSGSITVGGTAPQQDLTISGSGKYRGADLAGKAMRADISGSGDAEVNVSDSLDVTISGSGSLTYSGEPSVKQDVSGSGGVHRK